jgi:phospholipid transport system substrate-binding protein
MKKMLMVVMLCLFGSSLSAISYAAYYQPGAYPPGYAARLMDPATLLKQEIEKLTAFLRAGGSADPARLAVYLDSQVAPHFDFGYMARWAGGQFYHYLNDQQQAQLAQKIKQMFLDTLSRNLARYANQRIIYFPAQPSYEGRTVRVRANILPPQGYPVRLGFRFYQSPAGWKLFDVSADGSSALTYYRKQVASIARRLGRQGLIHWLAQ